MLAGINVGIVVLILGLTYALTSEGLWGAALMFFNILFSALIAFNFYETLAGLLANSVPQMSGYADTLCLIVLFIISLVIFRLTTESMAPSMVRFPNIVYQLGRMIFGLAGAVLTVAILLLAFYTSPVHKKVFGAINYDSKPPFGMAIDRMWLAFFQYSSEHVFAIAPGDLSRIFDPRAEWLIVHQNARPYGDDVVPEAEGGGAEAAPTGGGDAGGGAPPQMPGTAPAASSGQPGPGIPGGTAGAAAGLAPTNP